MEALKRLGLALGGTVGGFAYFYLLFFIAAMFGGAGHGNYTPLQFVEVTVSPPIFWSLYGVAFCLRNWGRIYVLSTAFFVAPYLSFLLQEIDTHPVPIEDPLLLIACGIFIFTQGWVGF